MVKRMDQRIASDTMERKMYKYLMKCIESKSQHELHNQIILLQSQQTDDNREIDRLQHQLDTLQQVSAQMNLTLGNGVYIPGPSPEGLMSLTNGVLNQGIPQVTGRLNLLRHDLQNLQHQILKRKTEYVSNRSEEIRQWKRNITPILLDINAKMMIDSQERKIIFMVYETKTGEYTYFVDLEGIKKKKALHNFVSMCNIDKQRK